jgi:F-type H+-transporting ATPase subunit delta
MNGGRVARRYARAAFDLAVSNGQEEEWLRDLRSIESILAQPELEGLLDNPSVPFSEKRGVVERALAGLDPLRRNFVYVLVEHGRTSAMSDIVEEFQRELNDYQGIAIAEVTTAVPLDEAESRAVARQLGQLVGKRIVLEKRVDPSILGGVIARIGDRLVDGSIAGQLEGLRRELSPS